MRIFYEIEGDISIVFRIRFCIGVTSVFRISHRNGHGKGQNSFNAKDSLRLSAMPTLEVINLNKHYPIFSTLKDRLLTALTMGLVLPSRKHQAIENLNLQLSVSHTGKIIGVVGPNGAGKSTLLRLLSGVSKPTTGEIRFSGQIRSILELGVGFSAELTARQNIENNGVLWSYPPGLLKKKMPHVLEFAGLTDYADQPLKTYSTGMQMRLAFSVATLERSDLLLVDEALAVGDASFQQKCLDRFRQFREEGSLIIIVSHDMNLLKSICDEMILLDDGRIHSIGPPTEVSRLYMDLVAKTDRPPEILAGSEGLETSIRLLNEQGIPVDRFHSGERATVAITMKSSKNLDGLTCGIHIDSATGTLAFGTNSYLLNQELHCSPAPVEVKFHLKMNLGPGKYSIGYSIHRGKSHASDCFFWSHISESFEVEAPTEGTFEGQSNLEPVIEILPVPD